MKVMFDSNVWRKIALPEENMDDPQYEALVKIHDAIADGRIEAYISENIFTLENIPRKERKAKVGSMRAKTKVSHEMDGNNASVSFTIGPNPKDAVSIDDYEYLRKPTEAALEMGFHIVRLPRIGGLTNSNIEDRLFQVPDFVSYYNKATEVGGQIESKGAGFSHLEALIKNYPGRSISDKVKNAPESDKNKIAAAIAEAVDGDAVTTSIGLGCDYFCTRDEAKGAGATSVFSKTNLSWLESQYGFIVKKPEEIATLL